LPPSDRAAAALGALAVAGNVLGVAFLWDVPGAYRPASLDAWVAGSLAHRDATAASAAAFVAGLVALAGWALALGRAARSPLARAGAATIAGGALVNAAGCVAPLVLAIHVAPACAGEPCGAVGRALLGLTLSLDALFNLLLGAGLAALGAVLARAGRPALGALGAAAGLATIPVAGQVAWDAAARLLAVAGPLWLSFVAATSVLLWRGRLRPAARPGEAAPAARRGAWAR
jgi:hypothetical protein